MRQILVLVVWICRVLGVGAVGAWASEPAPVESGCLEPSTSMHVEDPASELSAPGLMQDSGQLPLEEPLETLPGGKRRGRGLVIALPSGSFSPRDPLELSERTRQDFDDAARREGLRLLVPVAPPGLLRWKDGEARELEEPVTVPWSTKRGERLVVDLLERELAAGRADPRRLYLAGHGAGATAALELAARHPQLIAAVALWSGTPAPVWELVTPPAGVGNGVEVERARRTVGLVGDPVSSLSDVPVYLWTGSEDELIDREALQLFVQQMGAAAAAGRGHVLVWDQGAGGHTLGLRGPRAGLKFLKRRRKPLGRD
jgi:predicted esterase